VKLALVGPNGSMHIVVENYSSCKSLVANQPQDIGSMLMLLTRYKIGGYDELCLIPYGTQLVVVSEGSDIQTGQQ